MSGQSSNDDIFVFIMRHGEAESVITNDKSRALTNQGRAEVNQSSQWLAEQFCNNKPVALALVSPYVRARQTFQEVTNHIHFSNFEVCSDITPNGNAKLTHDYLDVRLSQLGNDIKHKSVLMVSHMPFVSYLLDELCDFAHMSLFTTGSVAVVRYSIARGKGELVNHFQGV